MLQELSIHNFAIINDLHLAFGSGLNILTGETGAGKSIIIDALGLLLGDRASAEWIRSGADMAQIEAVFTLPEPDADTSPLHQLIAENGLDDPDSPGWLTLSREVRLGGRNICRINGRTVSLQLLSEAAGRLIDVHGQGEHLKLLRPHTHIHLLDRYAGLRARRRLLGAQVADLHKVRAELQRLRQDACARSHSAWTCSPSRPRRSTRPSCARARSRNWKPNGAGWAMPRRFCNWRRPPSLSLARAKASCRAPST